MTIKDMHYSFKKRLNKVDSQQYRNLMVPEIDWSLNDACNLFVKMIAEPRTRQFVLGFESSQRTIDDIRTLVKSDHTIVVSNDIAPLPPDYQHFLRARVSMSKGTCPSRMAKVSTMQHDDLFEEDPNTKSSFEWTRVNALFTDQGLKLHTDGTFSLGDLTLSYIKKHPYMHNAEDFRNGTYDLPSGEVLTGTQNCILPDHVHGEVVDLAVLIVSGELEMASYPLKREKVNLNLS